jgi:sugar-specific transcriptional regulator TrmB
MSGAQYGRKVLAPDDGDVLVTARPTVTEKEIHDDRRLIQQRLDAAYLNLTDRMAPFQKEWDAGPLLALMSSVRAGAAAGASEWGDDFAEMFTKEMWTNLGVKIKDLAGSALDAAGDYSKGVYNDIAASTEAAAKRAGKILDNPDKTIHNWGWWQRNFEEAVDDVQKAVTRKVDGYVQSAQSAAQAMSEAAKKAQKAYKHREAILGLPELLVKGDPKPVQAFIDNVLMDIDPQLAKEIKNDPNFYMVLELISDHDSILGYLAYVGLAIESIPPNFLGYAAAKGGVYLLIELVLLFVTAIFSAGAVASARVASLVARLAASSAKLAKAAKKIERAKEALDALIRAIEDFYEAATNLRTLGDKLRQARQRGLVLRGNTRSTVAARKQAIKRDRKCQLCGSTQHTTPRHRLGSVVYRK